MLARIGDHPCDIHRIARACGVTLHDAEENRTTGRKPGHCYCKPAVRAIGRRHGESHLALVLKLINQTGNGRELHAATLQAVSYLVRIEAMPIVPNSSMPWTGSTSAMSAGLPGQCQVPPRTIWRPCSIRCSPVVRCSKGPRHD